MGLYTQKQSHSLLWGPYKNFWVGSGNVPAHDVTNMAGRIDTFCVNSLYLKKLNALVLQRFIRLKFQCRLITYLIYIVTSALLVSTWASGLLPTRRNC